MSMRQECGSAVRTLTALTGVFFVVASACTSIQEREIEYEILFLEAGDAAYEQVVRTSAGNAFG
ncbi:MAG: hypothetical protein QNL88_07040, partial [Acidobacteriota bacterium]|nr:hypothetical protein [Acidobacteriota bacterium]